MKRDMEELKKDVESVKILTTQKGFLESVNDMNLLRKKSVNVQDWRPEPDAQWCFDQQLMYKEV